MRSETCLATPSSYLLLSGLCEFHQPVFLSAPSSVSATLGKRGLLFQFASKSLEPTLHLEGNPACVYSFPDGSRSFSSAVILKDSPSVASSEAHGRTQESDVQLASLQTVSVTFHPDRAVCSDAPIDLGLPGIGARGQKGREAKSACSGLLVLSNSPSAPATSHACNKLAAPKNPGIRIEG